MNTTEEKIIMYDSPEAAIYREDIKGWVSSDGTYCGKGKNGEDLARYRSATHRKCECGNIIKMKTYMSCEACRNKKRLDEYNKLPFREYDRSPVVSADGDIYFFSEDEICDYLEDNELEEISLLFCEENKWYEINPDYWDDIMPENMEYLPKRLEEAMNNFNKVISELPPCSYGPGKIRTSYKIDRNEN